MLLTHGDALCLDDTDYQRFRAQVRSPAWRAAFLARPLAERERIARAMRDASESTQAQRRRTSWADVDAAAARGVAARRRQPHTGARPHPPARQRGAGARATRAMC